MQFGVPPWFYDEQTLNISKRFIEIHRKIANYMIDLISLNSSEPIIRPLWWLEPTNPVTFNISDQFLGTFK